MNRRELAAAIYHTAHLTGSFRLRSGALSSEYFDKYRFESAPRLLAEIARALAGLVPAGVQALGGLELGGVLIEGRTILLIEDVVTSGGQVVESAEALRRLGAVVTDALCVIDREAGGFEGLAAKGIRLHPLFRMSELKEAAA